MSFEQHPEQDRQGRDPQGADTTGRIHGADDHTARLPAHPRPEGAFGAAPREQPSQQDAGPFNPQQPHYAGGSQPQQQPYGGGTPADPYAPPLRGQGGNPDYGAPSYANSNPPYGGGPHGGGPSYGGGGGKSPHKDRRWAAVPVAAVLAAALASGGTYALTKNNSGSSTATGAQTTIVKADPADFANAGNVDWSATASKVSPSVVSITVIAGSSGDQGSGVILDKTGNIVTNNHVVTGSGSNAKVTVTLNDNRTYDAKIVGTDASTDLAVVKLDHPPSDLTPITFGDDKKLVVGQPVMAVGNALGLAGTVTTGIVSALNRPVTTQPDSQGGGDQNPFGGSNGQPQQSTQDNSSTTNAIQTSAAINPGNSGGALVSGSGKLIGINSSIATLGQSSTSSQSGNIGIGFAIPVTVVKNITSQLVKSGKAKHPQLGVEVDKNPATVELGGASVQGARIDGVSNGSPAAKAGLKTGDVVTKFDGQQIGSPAIYSLIGFVRGHNVGDKVTLTIVRDGKQHNVTVTLGEATSG